MKTKLLAILLTLGLLSLTQTSYAACNYCVELEKIAIEHTRQMEKVYKDALALANMKRIAVECARS